MKPRITVIDDESAYRSLITEFAAASFIECVEFSSWHNTLPEQMSVNDLLFLDIHMPELDGIDILMKLKESGYLGGVVVMSGADESVVASTLSLSRSLGLNVYGSLHKPFRLATFRNLVESFLNQSNKKNDKKPVLDISFTEIELNEGFKNGWIYPAYQPQVRADNKIVVGLECLTRINHPEHGEISPYLFIEKLTELGLIDQYTLLLIENLLSNLTPFLLKHSKVNISLNVASASLNPIFTNTLITLFKESGISFKRVTLEITESKAVQLSTEALYAVSKFRAQNFNLSIDDYGTGFSTIQLLKELPFNELKVDRSFVMDIIAHKKSEEIVKSIAILAENLNYTLVVEGVETERQLNILKKIGCNIIQGYLYSKPLKLEDLLLLVENSNILIFD